MKGSEGFTLIELIICVVIAVISIAVLFGHVNNSNMSVGYNGVVETRCIEGQKFIVDSYGQSVQIFNEKGTGIPCIGDLK